MPKGQKTKASHWLMLIEQWKQSGLNKKEFCLRRTIDYKNFTKWYSRLVSPRKMQADTLVKALPTETALFVPVEIKSTEAINPSLPAKPLVLILNKQIQLQIPVESVDASLLTLLFKSLGVHPC